MKHTEPTVLLLLIAMAFTATNVAFVSAEDCGAGAQEVVNNVCDSPCFKRNWSINLSIVELFILVFCFLFAGGFGDVVAVLSP